MCGLYDPAVIQSKAEERTRVIRACSVGSAILLVLPALSRGRGLTAVDILYVWLLTIAGTLALRETRRHILRRPRSRRRVLLVGSGRSAIRMWQVALA